MTNQNNQSAQFTPQSYTSGSNNVDLFASNQSFYQSSGQPRYYYRVQSTGQRGKYKGELIIYDFRGGTNLRFGDFNRDFDRTQYDVFDKLDTRFPGTLILPLRTTTAATPDPTGTVVGMSWERIFGRLMIGAGDGNGASLFRETSATNPAIEATAYNAGSAVTALDGIVMGGATATRKLLVSRAGAAPQLISDVDGTVDSTGHADLNPCWGACQTFLNNDSVLFYADNGIYISPKTAAISDAPTLTLSNIADGGFWLDNKPFRVGNGPYRCYLAVPRQDTSGGMVPFSTTGDFEILSVNQEGFDPVPVNFPTLAKITWAGRFRNGIIATDNYKLVYFDGSSYLEGHPFAHQNISTTTENQIAGVWVVNHDIYIRSRSVSASSQYAVTMYWSVDTEAWHFVSTDGTGTSAPTGCRSRGLPWSFNSQFYKYLHVYESGTWIRQPWVETNENPFFLQMDSSSGTAFEFENNGDSVSTIWNLPGLEGKPKALTAITVMGDLYHGDAADNTTAGYVEITVGGNGSVNDGGRSAKFYPPTDIAWSNVSQRRTFSPTEVFDKLTVTVALQQGSGGTDPTFYTMNPMPIKIEFVAWEYPTPAIGEMPSLPLTH